jgi:predicted nicotinamide N-methyase
VDLLVDEIEIGTWTLIVERPREPESLLDEGAFARDEFMPYWAEVWPSGIALARHVAGLDVANRSVLELGCGLGLPSLAAALAGATVVAADWAADALVLLRRNAERNAAALTTTLLDWREPAELGGSRSDLVLAADVLYEERNAAPLVTLLLDVVAADGEALVADPGRRHAELMLDGIVTAGWSVEEIADELIPRGAVYRLRPA